MLLLFIEYKKYVAPHLIIISTFKIENYCKFSLYAGQKKTPISLIEAETPNLGGYLSTIDLTD